MSVRAPVPDHKDGSSTRREIKQVNQYAIVLLVERRRKSEVYVCWDMDRRQYVRARAIHLGLDRYDGFTLQQELRTYRRLTHSNIVKITEVLHSKKLSTVWTILTDAPLYGSLDRFLTLPLSDQILATIFAHVLSALSYLHAQGLVHQDITMSDILLCPPGVAKLSDSGVGHRCDELVTGTPVYTAPETLDPDSETLIDPVKECMWSVAICLYAAAYGRVPYAGESAAEVFRSIMAVPLEFPGTRSEELVGLLTGMLAVDPAARMGLEEVKAHPFFAVATPTFALPCGYVELPPMPSSGEVVHITESACDDSHTFLCYQSLSCPRLYETLCDVKQ
jgi:serine/threonine protein kinase